MYESQGVQEQCQLKKKRHRFPPKVHESYHPVGARGIATGGRLQFSDRLPAGAYSVAVVVVYFDAFVCRIPGWSGTHVEFLENLDIGSILIQFSVLLFSLSLHEASHAWVADRLGDYTARYLGRVTLNPLAHADPVGTVLFPLLQFFTNVPLIGWAKPVPVNAGRLHHPRRDQMLVSLAGLLPTCWRQ